MRHATERIDAHLHVWDLQIGSYPWLGPEHGDLYQSFSPEQARAELSAAGMTGAVIVQAEDARAETEYLLSLADEHPWIRGVVGWLPLEDPAATARAIEQIGARSRLRGARHLIHEDPRPEFLQMPTVRESLRLVAEAGLAFDVPDAWPRHLAQTAALTRAVPELTVVIDHLGKPPRGTGEMAAWRAELSEVARRPRTVAKVSGLHVPGEPFTVAALREVWDTALELFGPDRLMFGSDWPMTVPHGGYGPTHDVLAALVAELSPDEQQQIAATTARQVYQLPGTGERHD